MAGLYDLSAGFGAGITDGYAVTPHDSVNFAKPFQRLYVGGAGNVVLVTLSGTVLPFIGVPVGATLAVPGVRVNAASTTATNLIGLY